MKRSGLSRSCEYQTVNAFSGFALMRSSAALKLDLNIHLSYIFHPKYLICKANDIHLSQTAGKRGHRTKDLSLPNRKGKSPTRNFLLYNNLYFSDEIYRYFTHFLLFHRYFLSYMDFSLINSNLCFLSFGPVLIKSLFFLLKDSYVLGYVYYFILKTVNVNAWF